MSKDDEYSVRFTITGNYLTNCARGFWVERRYGYAVHFLLESLVGLGVEAALDVLFGKNKFTGDSASGIGYAADNFSYAEEDEYAGTVLEAMHELTQRGREAAAGGMLLLVKAAEEVKCLIRTPSDRRPDTVDLEHQAAVVEYYRERYNAELAEQKLLLSTGALSEDHELLPEWGGRDFNLRTFNSLIVGEFDDLPCDDAEDIQEVLEENASEQAGDLAEEQQQRLNREYAARLGVELPPEEQGGGILTEYGEWFRLLQQKTEEERRKRAVSPEAESIVTQDCYIAPDGKIIHVGFQGHIGAAESIAKEYNISPAGNNCLGFRFDDYSEALTKAGFIQISASRLFSWTMRDTTQKQVDALFDWFYANGEVCHSDATGLQTFRTFPEVLEFLEEAKIRGKTP